MLKTNCSSIEHWFNKLGACFNIKREENKFINWMFDNKLLASSKKLSHKYFIFQIRQEDIWNYNLRCFMSNGFLLDDMNMNLLSDITERKIIRWTRIYFPKLGLIMFTCTKDLFRISHKILILMIPKKNYVHIISLNKRN